MCFVTKGHFYNYLVSLLGLQSVSQVVTGEGRSTHCAFVVRDAIKLRNLRHFETGDRKWAKEWKIMHCPWRGDKWLGICVSEWKWSWPDGRQIMKGVVICSWCESDSINTVSRVWLGCCYDAKRSIRTWTCPVDLSASIFMTAIDLPHRKSPWLVV
jgi:hypothetical protein